TFMQADPTMFPVLSLLDLSREFQLRSDGIFFGVNMAIRRAALFEAGGFNRELWKQGQLIGYVPDAIVYHYVPPERMTVSYLRRRQASDGACDMYARFHDRMPSLPGLARAALSIVGESA